MGCFFMLLTSDTDAADLKNTFKVLAYGSLFTSTKKNCLTMPLLSTGHDNAFSSI